MCYFLMVGFEVNEIVVVMSGMLNFVSVGVIDFGCVFDIVFDILIVFNMEVV